MPRTEARQAALVYCAMTIMLVICLFGWVALLTYEIADRPGTTVWPPSPVTRNLCGPVGAYFSHWMFYYLGAGAWPLMFLVTAAVIAKLRRTAYSDLWLRFAGTCLIVTTASTTWAMFPHLSKLEDYPLPGPGGVLGAVTAGVCQAHFQTVGTMLILAAGVVVGLILAADQWVMRIARLLGWARQKSVNVIASGSTVVGGAAVAGVERLAARLATAGASNAGDAAGGGTGVGTADRAPLARTSSAPAAGAKPASAPKPSATPAETASKAAMASKSDPAGRTDATSKPEPAGKSESLKSTPPLQINASKALPPLSDEPSRADAPKSPEPAAERRSTEGPANPKGDSQRAPGAIETAEREPAETAAARSLEIAAKSAAAGPSNELPLVAEPLPAAAHSGGANFNGPIVTQKSVAPHADPIVTQIAPTPALGKLTVDAKPPPRSFALPGGEEYKLPPLSLAEDPTPIDRESMEILCKEKAYILEQTLNEFRLEVRVVAIETGPVITVFELKLAPGIKVSQVVSLANDMARALKAPAVRVVAPLPGKNTIGIEVPNIDKEKVRIKELLAMSAAKWRAQSVPLFLGKDAAGQPVVADLTHMPHLLIAGTTGSGKSICVSSIVMSILMTRTPSEVNMILVDPKVVELSIFKEIPHLMCPIVTEAGKAEGILDWAATKMDERYALLAEAGVKDIKSYNRLGREGLRDRFAPITDEELDKIPQFLPFIVIVIDELADLMMTSAKEVEFFLCRLAQKSRAVGIHLIVSTQRPQANVVTGLIKSNLPCRIAFRVSSRLDSRIVLDQNGGEVLLGQGDMLYLPPGSSKLVRAQGTFISDEELRAVVKHACAQASPQFHPELVRMPGGGEMTGERDELFDSAVEMILESGRGSVSLLQRRLEVGYSRASRLIDQMYASGIVGEYKGSQAREVLMSKDDWQKIKSARDREDAAEASEEEAVG